MGLNTPSPVYPGHCQLGPEARVTPLVRFERGSARERHSAATATIAGDVVGARARDRKRSMRKTKAHTKMAAQLLYGRRRRQG